MNMLPSQNTTNNKQILREYRGGNDMSLAAIKIAKDGFKIFPCNDKKQPLVKNGFHAATNNVNQINEWWTKWPNAAIGMPTGAVNGFWVVDCDVKNGNGILEFLNICKEHNYNPDNTYIVETQSGGLHYYFEFEQDSPISNSAKIIAPNIDIRGDGGYVIVPPSCINGKIYKVNNNKTIQTAPSWLIELCKGKGHTNIQKAENNSLKANFSGVVSPVVKNIFERAINDVKLAPDGCRNDTLNRSAFLCGQLIGANSLDEDFARTELEKAASHYIATDGEHAAIATIKSGIEKGKLEPYQLYKNKPIEQIEKPRQPHEWNEPIAFAGMEVPKFSVDGLPSVIGDFIKALSEEFQIPIEIPFAMSFATVSIASQGKFVVKVSERFEKCLNLYVVAPDKPSTGKSPVVERCKLPIIAYQRKIRKEAEKKQLEIESERKNQIKIIEKKRKKLGDIEDVEEIKKLQKDIMDLENKLPQEIPMPSLLTNDVTTEKLGRLLADNDCMGILEAEGDLFGAIAGRYQANSEPNLGIWLKAYTIEPETIHRATKPDLWIERPCLAIGLAPQPECLTFDNKEMLKKFRARGLHARFDYFLSNTNIGNRNFEIERLMPKNIEDRFYNKITELLEMPFIKNMYGVVEPYVLTLDERAKELFQKFRQDLEPQFRAGEKLEYLTDWGGKANEKLLKYAGLLHIVSTDKPELNHIIPSETMEVALTIVNKLICHAVAAYALMNIDPTVRLAKRILEWIKRGNREFFTLRDCQQAIHSGTVNTTDIKNALSELIEREYIKRIDDSRSSNGGKPTMKFQSNVKIFL